MARSEWFVLHKEYENGGKVWLMQGLDSSKTDYNDLLSIAEWFADAGHSVEVLSPLHYKDTGYRPVFGELIGSPYYRKCPDLRIDTNYYEYEDFLTEDPKNALRNMLHNGLKQSDRVIIKQCGVSDGYIRRALEGLKKSGITITELWILEDSSIRCIYKTEG